MKVLVVTEFYPRAEDPVWGIWAHRQAVAARDAGAQVEVVVLHRPVPPMKRLHSPRAWRSARSQPKRMTIDGIDVTYVRYLSPPRGRSYGRWGEWAGPHLWREIGRREFDLIHAHNAVPAADAALVAGVDAPLIVSVHGGDLYFTVGRWPDPVHRAFSSAHMILANSAGIAAQVGALGYHARILHLGTDIPQTLTRDTRPRTVVTVGHLIGRKRHADVIRAVARLEGWRYLIIGDGPERQALERLAAELAADVEFTGQLPHPEALRVARECSVFAMPSTDEAFGVAYIEAMAGGLPAIGALGEPGPAEIEGMRLVEPGNVDQLAAAVLEAAAEDVSRARSVAERFSWDACGRATVAAYETVLGDRVPSR